MTLLIKSNSKRPKNKINLTRYFTIHYQDTLRITIFYKLINYTITIHSNAIEQQIEDKKQGNPEGIKMNSFQTLVCFGAVTRLDYLRSNLRPEAYSNETTFYHAAVKLDPMINISILTDWQCPEDEKLCRWWGYWTGSEYVVTEWLWEDEDTAHGAPEEGDSLSFTCMKPNTDPEEPPTVGDAIQSTAEYLRVQLQSTRTSNQIVNEMYPGCAT